MQAAAAPVAVPASVPDFGALLDRVGRPVIDRQAAGATTITTCDGWVGAWATCVACGTYTAGRLCGSCAADATKADVTAGAWRPPAVVALLEGEPSPKDDRVAVLRLPKGVRPRVRHVAEAVCQVTTGRLEAGWSLTRALKVAALGRDQLVADLAAQGHPMDRKTIAYVLDELADLRVISQTGQMSWWTDPEAQDGSRVIKTGAFLWALHVELRAIGQAALAAVMKAAAGCSIRSGVTSWGKASTTRIEKALSWAARNAYEGSRNQIGHWLACRCREAGLTEDDADVILSRYVTEVDQDGHRYDCGEASRTLRSVYRRLVR